MSTGKKTAEYPADGIVSNLASDYDDFNLFTCEAETHELPAAHPSPSKGRWQRVLPPARRLSNIQLDVDVNARSGNAGPERVLLSGLAGASGRLAVSDYQGRMCSAPRVS
jgi:hypothetical protein